MAHDIHMKFNFHCPQNKVLMAYGHLILSHVAFGRFHDALAGLSGCDRDCMMVKLRIFAIRQFMERVCCPFFLVKSENKANKLFFIFTI